MSLFFTGVPVTAASGTAHEVRLLRLPGTYAPQEDSHLLLETVLAEAPVAGARVLDLGTGTGRVALGLAAAGAASVTAVDISRRAVLTTRLNSLLSGVRVRARRGDLVDGLDDRQFDLIVANPPYVPSPGGPPGRHSRARAWDAGRDGREVLDRICALAPDRLVGGGRCGSFIPRSATRHAR